MKAEPDLSCNLEKTLDSAHEMPLNQEYIELNLNTLFEGEALFLPGVWCEIMVYEVLPIRSYPAEMGLDLSLGTNVPTE